MISKPRFETKYLLDYAAYRSVRNALAVGFRRDRFSSLAPNGRYYVASLYFDSWDFQSYTEKMHGENKRSKLRLRTYWKEKEKVEFVNVEEKRRQGLAITKHSSRVRFSEYEFFIKNNRWDQASDDVLDRFWALVRLCNLAPKVLVRYEREVFESRDGGTVRVSLDHNVRYVRADSLFISESRCRRDLANTVVLEIKTDLNDHSLVQEIVRRHGLKAIPNSKYVNAINHSVQPVWHGG
jgi:SPX domain protein involved in polyphosphate accumulation